MWDWLANQPVFVQVAAGIALFFVCVTLIGIGLLVLLGIIRGTGEVLFQGKALLRQAKADAARPRRAFNKRSIRFLVPAR
jgi:hypothetical protein